MAAKNQKAKAKAQQQKAKARANAAEAEARVRARPPGSAPTAAPAAPPAGTWVPGNPGVENPVVQPFKTAEDLMAEGEANFGWDTALNDIQSGLDSLFNQSNFDLAEIDKSKAQDLSTSADEMAGRGLYQSSIKDADLYDIESTARLRKDYIDTQLKTARMDADRQRDTIQGARDSFASGMNQKMVQNAQGVNADMPKWKVEPTAGQFQYTSPQTAPKKPRVQLPAQEQFMANQNREEQRANQFEAEAKARVKGKTGGRGKTGTVVRGAGSAGIR